MKLDYATLISPYPLYISSVGHIKSPKLKEIFNSSVTCSAYNMYLSLLIVTPEKYCTDINKGESDYWNSISDEEKNSLSIFDFIVDDKKLQSNYVEAFNFFLNELVSWDNDDKVFITYKVDADNNATPIGSIHKDIFIELCNIILQLNHISNSSNINLSKIKSKKGLERIKKIQKLKQQSKKEHSTKDPDINIENIISSVCIKHNSINYTNIFDLTVYQLWDTFLRLQVDNSYEINKTAVSVWGDKEKKFDSNLWFKNLGN